jgi:diguanylate cyclase (GGDEF)-like protein
MWLDGVIAATAVAAVSADVVVTAVLGSSGGSSTAALVTNLAYPIGDLILLGMVVGAVALEGWRVSRSWLFLAAGFTAFTVTDGLFLVRTADGTYQVGTIVDAGWLLCALLVACAAWQPAGDVQRLKADGWRFVIMPSVCALVAVALLVRDSTEYVTRPWTASMAALTLLGVIVRYGLTFREYMAMVRRSTSEAATDALTGLGNRRALVADLAVATGRRDPVALGLFDLDGFKAYNDAYGHPAGDALLARLGARLAAAVGAGAAYRMGGDEFCVLVACDPGAAEATIEGVAVAMAESGEGFCVRASYGAVELPAEAADPIDALRSADQRMYAQKQRRGAAAGKEISHTLMQALTEHAPGLEKHMSVVADLAGAVAEALGLGAADVAEIRRAAELHDVGKIAVPAAILAKPGALTDAEWGFVRRHTLIGERILRAAPTLGEAARLVRWSHERWDGGGYPDGLHGEETPLGARIIAVCDSYEAMTGDRPYHAAMPAAAAIAELRRCAGSQFDPRVVEAFCRVHRLRAAA